MSEATTAHPTDSPLDSTWAEVLVLGAVLSVAALGTSSLLLAQLSAHSAPGALVLAVVLLAPVVVLVHRERPRLRRAPRDLALAVAVGALGLVMFVPGFPYAYADKDPGMYVIHSWAIAREGSVHVDDPVLAANQPGILIGPGARFPGAWIDEGGTDRVTPQFFHFLPSLMATAVDVAGRHAAFHLNPLLGALSVVAFTLAIRRGFGTTVAAVAGGLLAISMPQVWQAKYPSTEILAQLLIVGALLAITVAIEARSRTAALVGGVLIGTGLLARPDGLLLVLAAAGVAGVLLAADRFRREARWATIGLAVTLPYAFVNAYDLRRTYTLLNDVPDLPLVLAAIAVCLVGGWAARGPVRALRRRLGDHDVDDVCRMLGMVVAGGFALMLLGFTLRPLLLGKDYTNLLGVEPKRSFDEYNLDRLTFYLTRAIVPLAVAGMAIVGWQRWRAARWALLVPGLLMTPLYLWEAQISPRLMWWVRRFVPGVVPFLILLSAVAIGWALTQRRATVRVVGAVVLVTLAVGYLQRSWPLREHREMAGSYDTAAAIAGAAGPQQGLFLWQRPKPNHIFDPSRNLGAVVWFGFDQLSALLPDDPDQGAVDAYATRFPDRPVFVVTTGDQLPPRLEQGAYTEVKRVQAVLPVWEEEIRARPARAISIPVDVVIWRLDGAPNDQGS